MTRSSGENAAITEAHMECCIEECWFAGLVNVDVDPDELIASWRCPSCETTQCVEWEALF